MLFELGARLLQHVCRERADIGALAPLEPALAAGQRQQRLDQPLLVAAVDQQLLTDAAQRLGAGVRVGQRHLQQRALDGERRAQLVRSVGDEAALRVERCLEPCQQIVERLPQLGEFVASAAQSQTLVQVSGGDRAGASGDLTQRPQHPAGREPAQRDRRQRSQRQHDPGHHDQARVVGVLLGDDRIVGPHCDHPR